MLEIIVKTLLLITFTSVSFAKVADAADPCEPSYRKSCGRAVISIVGAGEASYDPSKDMNETVDGDKHGAGASKHFLQFKSGNEATIPVQHILLTSDPDLAKWAKNQKYSQKAKLAGVAEMSIPAFENLVSPNSKTSPLNNAILSFANDENCKILMGLKPGEKVTDPSKVLPFLKFDILIDGELAKAKEKTTNEPGDEFGISIFKNSGTVGSDDRWLKDGTIIGQSEVDKLVQRLSGSVVNVFAKTCKSGLIGKLFDNSFPSKGICGCFLSITDEKEDDYTQQGDSSPFTYAMPDRKALQVKNVPNGVWDGADNIMSVTPGLLDRNMFLTMNPTKDAGDREFIRDFNATMFHKNPLYGFAYTSADAEINSALEKMSKIPETATTAKALLEAEYVKALPEVAVYNTQKGTTASDLDQNVERTRYHIESAKKYLGNMVDDNPISRIDTTVYDQNIKVFKGCISVDNPTPVECAFFKKTLEDISNKKNKGEQLSSAENNLFDSYDAFAKHIVGITFSQMMNKLVAGKESPSEFLTKMNQTEDLFADYKQKLDAYLWSIKKNPNDELPRDKQKAVTLMTESFDNAYSAARDQIFNYLKKEAITTKIKKLESTINFVAANAASVPGAEKIIANLASKLNCLTQYAVGPAHDKNGVGPIKIPAIVQNTTRTSGDKEDHTKKVFR